MRHADSATNSSSAVVVAASAISASCSARRLDVDRAVREEVERSPCTTTMYTELTIDRAFLHL